MLPPAPCSPPSCWPSSPCCPSDAFLAWGWRIPFLLSAVLVGIGLYVRLKVTESPLFEQEVITAVASEKKRLPIVDVLRNNPTSVLLGIGAGSAPSRCRR